MNGRARPWRSKRQQIDLTPVLRRSVELAIKSGHSANVRHAPLANFGTYESRRGGLPIPRPSNGDHQQLTCPPDVYVFHGLAVVHGLAAPIWHEPLPV